MHREEFLNAEVLFSLGKMYCNRRGCTSQSDRVSVRDLENELPSLLRNVYSLSCSAWPLDIVERLTWIKRIRIKMMFVKIGELLELDVSISVEVAQLPKVLYTALWEVMLFPGVRRSVPNKTVDKVPEFRIAEVSISVDIKLVEQFLGVLRLGYRHSQLMGNVATLPFALG